MLPPIGGNFVSRTRNFHVGPSSDLCPQRDYPSRAGEGAFLFTRRGERYLDFSSGIAVTALGHAHPHLIEALTGRPKKVWHVSNLHRIAEQERLGQRLCDATFADRVFFANSGAEAVGGRDQGRAPLPFRQRRA